MNDESDEFLELFSEEIVYIDGARTQSGFYTVEKAAFVNRYLCRSRITKKCSCLRLYRAWVDGPAINMEPVPLSAESLDPRFVFLLDTGKVIWVWSGAKSRASDPKCTHR